MSLLKTGLSRRKFLAYSGGTLASAAIGTSVLSLDAVASSHNPSRSSGKTKFIPSSCAICVNKCGLVAEVNGGIIRKLNPNHKFFKSQSMLCARGNAGAKVPYDPDRLKHPLRRKPGTERGAGQWEKITWEEAYEEIAKNVAKLISEQKNRSTIAFGFTEGLQEHSFANLASLIGSTNTVMHPTLCLMSNIQGYSSVYGTLPDADIENAKFVVMAGSNRAEAIITPDTMNMAKKRREQTLVYIDPRATKTNAMADKWFPIKPGTDLALVLAMMNIIIAEELYDKEFIDKYTVGFEELSEHVKKYTAEWASKETEIDVEEIYWLARSFAKAAPASVWYPGRRSSFMVNDVYYRKACATLNAIVGAWDRKGGLVPKSGIKLKKHELFFPYYEWVEDRADKGKLNFLPELLGDTDKENAGFPTDKVAFVSEKAGSWLVLREAILKGVPYPIKGMFFYKQNPVESVPNRSKTLEMLKKLDFICTIDIQMSDTAWYSDIVLPESTYLERWDPAASLGGIVPVVVFRQPVIEPLFDTKPMNEIFVELGLKILEQPELQKDVDMDELEEFKAELEKEKQRGHEAVEHLIKFQMSGYSGGFEKLIKEGMFALTDKPVFGKTLKEGARLKTKTGKIELYSKRYEDKGLFPLPVYIRRKQPGLNEFRFVVGRHAQFTQSTTQNNPYLLEAFASYENYIWINKKVALKKGIKLGDKVKVKSSVGEQEVTAYPTEFIRPDTVYYQHGFGRLSKQLTHLYRVGASDAAIIEDHVDTISGNAAMHETMVTIEKI